MAKANLQVLSSIYFWVMGRARLGLKLCALNQANPSLSSDAIDWIMNAKVFQNPRMKEKLQEFLDEYPIFQLAADIAIDSSARTYNEHGKK